MIKAKTWHRERLFLRALQGREQVYNLIGEYSRELEDCRKALSFCKKAHITRTMETSAMVDLADALRSNRAHGESKKLLVKALKRIDSKNELQEYARALNILGMLYDDMGEGPEALQYFHESLKIARATKNNNGIASGVNNIGLSHWSRGELEQALRYFREALKCWKAAHNKGGIGVAAGNMGLIYFSMGELNSALEYFLTNLEVSREVNHKVRIVIALGNIGEVSREKGNYDDALALYQEALQLAAEMGNTYEMAFAHLYIGAIYCEKGTLREAKEHLKRAEKTFVEMNHKVNLAGVYLLLARIHREEKNLKHSLDIGKKAYTLSVQTGAKEQQIGALRELAQSVADGHPGKAAALLERSISIAEQEKMSLELAKSCFSLACMQRMTGQKGDTKKNMERARRIFKRAGARVWLRKIDNFPQACMPVETQAKEERD